MKPPDRTHFHAMAPLRVVAAYGIVWFHAAAPERHIGYAGLPAFLMMSFFLLGISPKQPEWSTYLQRRTVRLLLPWLIWSAVYWGLARAPQVLAGAPPQLEVSLGGLLTGGKLHLWYLPAAFLGALLVGAGRRALHHYSMGSVALGGVLCLAALVWLRTQLMVAGTSPVASPWGQWLFAAPSLPVALVIARAAALQDPEAVRRWVGGTVVVACALWLVLPATTDQVVSYLVALPLFGLAVCVPVARSRALERAAELTLGIYILHPLMGSLLARAAGLERSTFLYVTSSFLLAAGITAAIRRFVPRGREIL